MSRTTIVTLVAVWTGTAIVLVLACIATVRERRRKAKPDRIATFDAIVAEMGSQGAQAVFLWPDDEVYVASRN